MPGDDLRALQREYDRLASALLRMDSMSPVERQELVDAMARFEVRFERFEREAADFRREVREEMGAMRDDLVRIKALAKGAMWIVASIGGLALIVTTLTQIGTHH